MFNAAKEEMRCILNKDLRKETIFYSNSLEVLFEHLKVNLFSEADGVFSQRLVIIPSLAMQQWIQLQLASSLSISCGIQFFFLDRAIETLKEKFFLSEKHNLLPSQAELMIRIKNEFALIKNLPDVLWTPLKEYLKNEKREIALSDHLARLFLKYGIYGEKNLQQWEKAPVDWQQALWKRIFCDWDYPQRVLIDLQQKESLPGNSSIHLFAFSYISPLHFNFFTQVSQLIPLSFYQLSPCQEFWSDLSSYPNANFSSSPRLLSSLGKMGREMSKMIENSHLESEEGYVIFGGETRLRQLQRDLLLLSQPEVPMIEDDSIQIHITSTRHQEILHLYRCLTSLMEKEGLEPKDVIVMAPDMTLYTPYIQAIFEELGYQIADLPITKNCPSIVVFFLILDLEAKRWSAPALLELLAHPLFSAQHDLREEDLEQIREWVYMTGIRWGFNGHHRSQILKSRHCSSAVEENVATWMEGLGYLIEELALPCPEPSRQARIAFSKAELLGDFITLLHSLYSDLQQLKQSKILSDWIHFFRELVSKYIFVNRENSHILNLLEKVERTCSRITEGIYSFELIDFLLKEEARTETTTLNKNSLQAVRFCSMLPMRAIPAKMICLIGMNHNAFPRKDRLRHYDLLHSSSCPSRSDFDRYLFLEALISAREKLWISYQGIDCYDLSELPPSTLVAELLSVISTQGSALPTRDFFKQTAFPFVIKVHTPYTLPKGHFVITTSELTRLSRSALQHYFAFQGLRIGETKSLSAEETLILTPRLKGWIRKEGLKAPENCLETRMKRRGELPGGILGTLASIQIHEEIDRLGKVKLSEVQLAPLHLKMNSSLDVTFVGSIDNVFAKGLSTSDALTVKGAVKIWPQSLLLNWCDRDKKTVLFANSGECREIFFEDPKVYLYPFVEYYFYTREHPFPMIADWIEAILKKDRKKLTQMPIFDPALKWQMLGRTNIDYDQVIDSCYPIIEKTYREMYEAWF